MDFSMLMVFVFISVINCVQRATKECNLYTNSKYMYCYRQNKVNTVPVFPSYNGTLNYIQLHSSFILRSLDKNSFRDAPLTKRFRLWNIGLQHLSCDVFLRFRRDITILNLDDNLLEHFPSCAFNNLAHLETLTMRGNFVTCVPEHSIPWSLLYLDLSDNKIVSLGSSMSTDVYNPSSLKTLIIDTNQLSRINGDEFFQFSSLEKLDASNNLLEYIHPKSFESSRNNITYIDLSNNKLDGNIWQSLVHLQELNTLKLSHNRIDVLEEKVTYNLKNLYELDISYNKLSRVGPAFDSQGLKRLALHHNNIVNVSNAILTKNTNLTQFFEVNLSYNDITNLTIELSSCSKCTLRASNNRLRQLEIITSFSSSFKRIDMSFNMMPDVPVLLPQVDSFIGSYNPLSTQSIITFLEQISIRSVQFVSFQSTRMLCDEQTLVPEIRINNSLKIDLKDNCVPIDFLCQLRSDNPYEVSINLDRNSIRTFLSCPLNVSVVELSLKGNFLTVLRQYYIDQVLGDLRYLDIAENNISVLPHFPKDMYYDASKNNIHVLPREIGCPDKYASVLDLSSNFINTAYEMEINCSHISFFYLVIDLSNNNLTQNPTILAHLSSDQNYYMLVLNFTGNKIQRLTSPFYSHLRHYSIHGIIVDLSKNNASTLNISIASMCKHNFFRTIGVIFSHNLMRHFPSCDLLEYECRYFYFELDFSHNLLQMLPTNETCVIGRVRKLDISYNLLTEISMPIANSTNLWYLTLSRNRISSITPNAFVGLSNLMELDLSFNRLQFFPDKLNQISRLRELNLAGNYILSIPDDGLSRLPYFSYFYFAGNPLICSCSTVWIKNYTLRTDFGYCSNPSESISYPVTCLSTQTCNGEERVYTSRKNIEDCSKSEFTFKSKDDVFSWDLSPKNMAISSYSRTDVLILQECKVTANYSYENVNQIRFQTNITERNYQLCVKITDESWVTHVMECLAINNSYTENYSHTEESSTEPSLTQINEQSPKQSGGIPQDVSIGLITFLSVAVFICGGITGVAVLIVKRRGSTNGSANQQRTIQGNSSQQNIYENVVSTETSFSSLVADNYESLHMTEDTHTYEDIQYNHSTELSV